MKTKQKTIVAVPLLVVMSIVALTGCEQHTRPVAGKSSTDTSGQLLPAKSMQEDLSVLFNAFKEVHPAYGLYTAEDSMASLYRQISSGLDHPMSEKMFISAIYPLVSALKCGHTQIKRSAGYKPYGGDYTFQLPFEVLVEDNKVKVTAHRTKELATGDELLAVNDVPVADIVHHGSDLYAMDGNNRTFKELFLSEYGGFEDACNKYYRWAPPYHIRVRTKDSSMKEVTIDTVSSPIPPVAMPAAVDNYKGWSVSPNTAYLPLRYLPQASVASFEVHTFQYEDTVIYRKAFREIRQKGVKNLIIDLRHNTGGDIRIAAQLLTYLADAPFQMVAGVWARVPDPTKTRFERYFDKEASGNFAESFKPTGVKADGHYKVDFQPVFGDLTGSMQVAPEDHYNGHLFVLTDGATFSSGAHAAAAIKQYCPKAIFIGRETGGGSEGCSGGTIQHLTLPNTGIRIDFPLLRMVSVLQRPTRGQGIVPDTIVHYLPEDVVAHNDPDLKAAMKMIVRGK